MTLAILAAFAIALSQGPPPTPPEDGQPEQEQSETETPVGDANNEQAATSPQDVETSIDIQAGNEDPDDTESEDDRGPAPYRWLDITSTLLVTLFTGTLAFVAWQQWKTTAQSAQVAKNAFIQNERAFLGVGDIEWMPSSKQLTVALINEGRVSVTDFTVELNATVFDSQTGQGVFSGGQTVRSSPDEAVLPGAAAQHGILVRFPQHIDFRSYDAGIRGVVDYDIGFDGRRDSLYFGLSFNNAKSEWFRFGGQMTEVNLTGTPDLKPKEKK
jgi:hypothetical protein